MQEIRCGQCRRKLGDTFGLSYREQDTSQGPFILPTTSPVQFDPVALHASIDRLVSLKPAAMYLTHCGPVTEVHRLAAALHGQIDALVTIAQTARQAGTPDCQRRAWIKRSLTDFYAARLAAHGWHGDRALLQEQLGMDFELNAQGLDVWLSGLQPELA